MNNNEILESIKKASKLALDKINNHYMFLVHKYNSDNKNTWEKNNYEGINEIGWYLFNSISYWLVVCCA